MELIYINFARNLDYCNKEEPSILSSYLVDNHLPPVDILYLLSKDKSLKSIWILLYSGCSNEHIAYFLDKPINEINQVIKQLDDLKLDRNKEILKLITPTKALNNSFRNRWLSKKKHSLLLDIKTIINNYYNLLYNILVKSF